MAKIIAPLLSLEAHGTLGKYLTFSKRKSGQQVRYQRKQTDVNSEDQQEQRAIYTEAVEAWNALSSAEQQAYIDEANEKKLKMSGYNLFVQEFINEYELWKPTDITGCQLWLDPTQGVYSDAGSTPAEDNDTVQEWHDRSEHGRHVEQTTEADKPTFKTNVFNGKPALYFNENLLKTISGKRDTISQPNTIIVVAKLDLVESVLRLSLDGYDHTARQYFYQTSGAKINWYAGEPRELKSSDTNNNIFNLFFSGSNSIARVNGSQKDAGNVGSNDIKLMTIGSRYSEELYWKGYITEVIVYNKELSSEERTQVEEYLADKYGITLV